MATFKYRGEGGKIKINKIANAKESRLQACAGEAGRAKTIGNDGGCEEGTLY